MKTINHKIVYVEVKVVGVKDKFVQLRVEGNPTVNLLAGDVLTVEVPIDIEINNRESEK